MSAPPVPACPQCGRSRTADPATQGLCAACLLATVASMDEGLCPYDVVAPIEQDRQGITYLAHRRTTALPSFVALKIVAAEDGEAILLRFGHLRPALARLQHPGVAHVIDVGSNLDGSVYIASHYVAGSPLPEMLSRASFGRGDRLEVARQLRDAVAAAHAAGVVHLALDPSQVKVSTAGGLRATIIGFGLGLVADGRTGGPDVDQVALESIIRMLDL